jgi:hypothetical protein
MNISGYGVSYNYSSYSSLANKAKTSSASTVIPAEKPKTSSVSLPSEINTKTEPTRSDKEILEAMKELAKKHAEKGTFQNQDYEFQSLMEEYVSSASPDRKSILENTVNEINEKIKISNPQKSGEKRENFDSIGTLLQVLENMEKGGNKRISNSNETLASISSGNGSSGSGGGQIIFNMSGGNYDAYVENGEVKFAHIRDSNGDTVMYFNNRNSSGQLSVTMSGTEREGWRSAELLEAYNETYREVSSSKGLVSGNSFDAVV